MNQARPNSIDHAYLTNGTTFLSDIDSDVKIIIDEIGNSPMGCLERRGGEYE